MVLRVGPDADTVTLTHHAEYLADVPAKRTARRRYVRADTGELFVDSIDDSDGIAEWEHGDYFPQILLDFIAAGRAATGPVGRRTAEVLDALEFVEFATTWMEHNLVT